ncbi:MAG: GNAT family N-acetyltransferase, partial [Proteobacteria bacterium]
MTPEIYHSFRQISREDWQTLAPPTFPFVSYDFLYALESTGCLGKRTGWLPVILILGKDEAALVAFIKNNSYGEYIFDFAWAQAHESHGLQYYPKMVSAIPFTPATGPKLLFAERLSEEERAAAAKSLLSTLATVAQKADASSEHFLFIPEKQIPYFVDNGYFLRHSFQFHWRNADYKSFNDFTATMKGKRRREINRERSQVSSAGLKIERLTGDCLNPEHGEIMYQFYLSTIDKMSGMNYLTADFFREIFKSMKNNIMLVLATNADNMPVAGALN